MELLHDYFERLDEMPWGTVVLRLLRPLPDLQTMTISRDLPMADKLALMTRAVDRETQATGEAMLRLSRALLRYMGRTRVANGEVRAVILQHGGDPFVMAAAKSFPSPPGVVAVDIEGHRHDPLMRAMGSLAV